MRFEYFLTLLKNCNFIIGNSSAGIRHQHMVLRHHVGSRQMVGLVIKQLKRLTSETL